MSSTAPMAASATRAVGTHRPTSRVARSRLAAARASSSRAPGVASSSTFRRRVTSTKRPTRGGVVRVRALGGPLPDLADVDLAATARAIKATELELSAEIWRGVDGALDALSAARDDLVSSATASADATAVAASTASRALVDLLPDALVDNVASSADALVAALPPSLVRVATDAATEAANAGVGAKFAAAAVVLALAPRLLGFAGAGNANAGMDEWAALAASEGEDEPDDLKEYDPKAIVAFFKKRPLVALKRMARSGRLLGGFGFDLWLDRKILGDEPEEKRKNEVDARRAAQLRDLLIALGPTYVKLGQVLSSRQDLLPAAYVKELRTLQDAVPPFDDALARRILEAELGVANARALALSDAPIASASLGQVYRGTLRDADGSTKPVAVKVQRPGALVAISLDVGIIRSFAEPWRKFKGLNTDLESLVDEWGRRFVEELDYEREANNGERFRTAMESRPDLAGVVTAPKVQRVASTRRVLTTDWIEGQRLDTSEEGDVPRLCAVALAAYLAMLLDIGVLHADPHPGNLFRTADGKLCILDWGLVTPVSDELSTATLKFIAHLVSKDFERVPADLDAMGFIPTGKREAMEDAGVASAIGLLFSALAKGGGAEGFRAELGLPDEEKIKEIRKELKGVKDMKVRREKFLEASGGADSKVAQLTRDLEGIQEKYGNIFQIPSYFGYILRSFSVLEGIGLASDKNYSIANECYPYVARRLLTDRSPDTRAALEQLLYGRDGPRATLSVKRVKQLANAFGNYSTMTGAGTATTAMAIASADETTALTTTERRLTTKKAAALSDGAKEALRLAFAPEGGPVQDIMLREMARYAAASASEAVSSVAAAPATALFRGLADAQQAAFTAMGPARPPLPTALEFFAPVAAATRQTEEDLETLRVAEELRELISGLAPGGPGGTGGEGASGAAWVEVPVLGEVPNPGLPRPPIDGETLRELFAMAPELAPGAQAAALRFGSVLLEQAAQRVADAEKDDAATRS